MTTPYVTGTVSVTAGSAIVTGAGTGWQTAGLVAGVFGLDSANGNPIPVLSVDSDTQITLAKPWRGTTASGQAYWITYDTTAGQQTVSNAQRLAEYIARLDKPTLAAMAGLTPAADKIAYFTGPNGAALADFNAAARALLAGGQLPNAQVRNDLTPDKAFRRGNILGTVAQASGVPTGAVIERGSNANGEYIRFADGTQICTKSVGTGDPTINAGAFAVISTSSYPASFAASPQQFLAYDGSWAPVALVNNEGKSASATGSLIISNQDTVAHQFVGVFNVFAIGRWF